MNLDRAKIIGKILIDEWSTFFCKFHLYISLISIGIGNGSKFLQKLMMLILSRLMLVHHAAFKI